MEYVFTDSLEKCKNYNSSENHLCKFGHQAHASMNVSALLIYWDSVAIGH